MKKLMSLLIVFLMTFSLTTPVKADGYTITVDNTNTGHTYEAYQIFTGDLDKTESILSNIQWATGVSLNKTLTITVKENGEDKVVTLDTAAKVAAALGDGTLSLDVLLPALNLGAADASDDFDEDKYELNVPTAGYYLVKDQEGTLEDDHDAYTDYIVKVVKSVTVKPKNVYPTVDKLVWDEEADAEQGAVEGWNETADHNLNETFQFKLIATLPAEKEYDEYHNYEDYKVIFTDTMSAGVTFERIVSVKVDGQSVNAGTAKTDYACSATAGQAGGSWTLTIEDALDIAGVDITDGAIIEVIYDAHLNENAVIGNIDSNKNTVYLKFSNNPNVDGDLGKTPEDHVWVFTYQVNGTKVNGASKTGENTYSETLKDAQFVLYRGEGTSIEYVQLDANSKVTGWTSNKDLAARIKSNDDGLFYVIGLDHGTYHLEETVAPDGYNLLDKPVEIKITAVHNEVDEEHAQTLNGEHTPNINVTVENNEGARLPSTGGMGTTVIYTIGGLLFAGAAVLLITKKRMNEE